MFEKFSPTSQSVESVESSEKWRTLRENAPQHAEELLATRIPEDLVGHDRLLAIIQLAQNLQDADPQTFRFLSEELCRRASFEQVASQQQALQAKYGNQYTVH